MSSPAKYMDVVRVLSNEIIKAPKSTYQKIDLTPWDLQFLPIAPTTNGLIYNHPLVENQIQLLKHSLSSSLAFFPPLAGRLEITEHEDNTVSCSVTCNNAGVLFVHATTKNTYVADILGPTYVPPIVHSFFPSTGVRNQEGTSKPLLAVQVTEFIDGIFIGCSFNHVVVDGQSAWHFINSWAEISRCCCNQISKLPTLERWFPNDIQRPIRFPLAMEQQKKHFDGLSISSLNGEKLKSYEMLFHFKKEKIRQLKLKANVEMGTNKISSLQALLAHLWCSMTRSKQLDPQEEVCYIVVIGARPRLVPPLPADYFGNGIIVCEITMKAGELLKEGGLGNGAWEMHKMIALHSNEKLKNEYEYWLKNPNINRLVSMTNINSMLISSSPWFDVYGNDFGWGKPIAIRTVNKKNGTTTVFAGIEEGSIDLQVCLPYKILEAMRSDPDFMHYVSN